MKNKNKKKNVLLIVLIILVVGMAIGYAGFSRTLTINGTATISSTWNVHIDSITAGTLTGATGTATVAEGTNPTSATFDVTLQYPGASATYAIVVHNEGSVAAILDSITYKQAGTTKTLTEINSAEPTGVTFTCDAVEDDPLDSTATKTYNVTVAWDANDTTVPATTSKTITIELNYVQNT